LYIIAVSLLFGLGANSFGAKGWASKWNCKRKVCKEYSQSYLGRAAVKKVKLSL
jgi:hypothetical protein